MDRLQAELEALRDAHARDAETLRMIREVVPVSIYMTDLRTGQTIGLNADVVSILGYAPGEVEALGSELLPRIIHPQDQPKLLELMQRWADVKDARWLDAELRMRHADGSWRWIASRDAVLERDADGTVTKLVGTAWDITQRKELESALARSQTLEAVGRLAGGVAHDFNNLLTVMLGSVSLAQQATVQGTDPGPMLEQVAAVAREASRLTKQLLTFASREIGSTDVIDIGEELRGSVGILRRLVEEDVEVSLECDDAPAWVSLQRAQLTQLLLNLVVNARDAMPRGGCIAIRVAPVDRPGEDGVPRAGVGIRVEDTGDGMSPETVRRIFDPFFTTKLPGKGTGLGLSTVYGIVRGRGGDVDVRSEEGRGTTFDIWFPAVAPAMPISRRAPARQAAVAPGTTVLVVEDSPALAETCVAVLGGAGYRVLVARDGVSALELLAREGDAVAAVLSDVVMPRLSGTELARRLAELRPRTRIVLWSGYPQGIAEPRDNVVAVLPKPVEPELLLQTIARAVAAR